MHYAKIRDNDIANGEGVRVSLFVSGCRFHCPDCFNPDQQAFDCGPVYTDSESDQILHSLRRPEMAGLSLLGGDPLWQEPEDILTLCELADRVHELGRTVWTWTGFTWEQLMEKRGPRFELVSRSDVLVDGPYIASQADRFLVWKGSANQRVIDVAKSLTAGEPVLYRGQYERGNRSKHGQEHS